MVGVFARMRHLALDLPTVAPYATAPDGAIAQLGERLHGMQEVSGSIPLSSTTLPTRVDMRGPQAVAVTGDAT